jgi:UTP--glucose-1-phosphate uridylyltransferase
VLLGDDLIDPRDPLLARMIEVQKNFGGSVVALIAVDPDQIHLYGCAATLLLDGEADLVRVTDLVEKPAAESAPSNLAIIGRYVLAPEIFGVLRETPPGRGGEIQLTDALRVLAADPSIGGPVHGVLFSGRRYDTGDRADYLRTIVKLACERDDLGPGFREWLEGYVAKGFTD